MGVKYSFRILLVLLFGFVSDSYSQSIYLNFDRNSEEKCLAFSRQGEKQYYTMFSKQEKKGNVIFRICSEEFVYTSGDYSSFVRSADLKTSGLEDLYDLEDEILAKLPKSDSVVHILFNGDIDSVFIAERLDNQMVKVYAVKWVEKIE